MFVLEKVWKIIATIRGGRWLSEKQQDMVKNKNFGFIATNIQIPTPPLLAYENLDN